MKTGAIQLQEQRHTATLVLERGQRLILSPSTYRNEVESLRAEAEELAEYARMMMARAGLNQRVAD